MIICHLTAYEQKFISPVFKFDHMTFALKVYWLVYKAKSFTADWFRTVYNCLRHLCFLCFQRSCTLKQIRNWINTNKFLNPFSNRSCKCLLVEHMHGLIEIIIDTVNVKFSQITPGVSKIHFSHSESSVAQVSSTKVNSAIACKLKYPREHL